MRSHLLRFAALAAALATFGAMSAPSAAAQTVEDEKARIARLQDAVLAPCCYTQPVSRHQSEIAVKMRLEIARWVAEGKSDEAILSAYVERYGAKVLVDPRTRPSWWMPLIPWTALIMGTVLCLWLTARWQAGPVPAPVGVPDLAQLPEFDEDE